MGVEVVESQASPEKGRIAELFLLYEGWGLPPHHLRCFVMCALLGSWQEQFQEREKPITVDDCGRGAIRTAQEMARYCLSHESMPATDAFDAYRAATARMFEEYGAWCRYFLERGNGLLDRARSDELRSELDEKLYVLWKLTREKFWPARNIEQFYRAAGYALHVLGQRGDDKSREAQLVGMREILINEGVTFRGRDGALRLSGWGMRDQMAKHLGLSRPRPKRRKRRQTPPPTTVTMDASDEVLDASTAWEVTAAVEFVEPFQAWIRSERKKVRPHSAKGRLLSYMSRKPGQPPPIRQLARRYKLDPGGMSRAMERLRLSLQEFLATHGP